MMTEKISNCMTSKRKSPINSKYLFFLFCFRKQKQNAFLVLSSITFILQQNTSDTQQMQYRRRRLFW